MYPEQSKLSSEAAQSEPQLQSILSSFAHLNDRTGQLISEINIKIDIIHPYNPTPEGNRSGNETKNIQQVPSVVNELHAQIARANQNADRLELIVRQLNTII